MSSKHDERKGETVGHHRFTFWRSRHRRLNFGWNATFPPKAVALLYMSTYLGYLIAPTHLYLTFTVDYFKCSIDKFYEYVTLSFLISFPMALLIYLLV